MTSTYIPHILLNRWKVMSFTERVKTRGGADLGGKKSRIFSNLGRDVTVANSEIEVLSLTT